ncbi:DUF6841 family protein [Burkholderia cepacia]|uniref:DUF6841 family protein n=1 Tax=Burkholderia cepacia TaxID=292 RepID=UPI00264FA275|nr:hypothetical protein [Burkholderia cepacia]MDN7638795.1 hypothetical protein [Burkholderia cepacia]
MVQTAGQFDEQRVLAEVWHWFFDDYLPRWAAAGERGEDSSFVTEYWGAPLWVSIDDTPVILAATEAEVAEILRPIHGRLKAAGYSHTSVPDRRVTVFNSNSAQISAIWSRRRPDESEIERCAVNFSLMRRKDGWRVLHIQQKTTDASDLADVWTAHKTL